MKSTVYCLAISMLFGIYQVKAQKSVGIGIANPNKNAVLELVSPDSNQGLLVPKLTTAQRTASSFMSSLTTNENGLLVFDKDENKFYFWNINQWQLLRDGLELTAGTGVAVNGSIISAIPQDLQLSGSVLTITNNPSATPILLSAFTGTNTDDQTLTYDGSSGELSISRITGGSQNVTITTSGAAGGDFSGTYPNPVLGTNAVTSGKILDGTIITGDVADGAITDAKIAAGLAPSKISAGTAGQLLTTVGGITTWQDPSFGSVSSVGTGTGLIGGPITAAGIISLANTTVTAGSYGTLNQVPSFTVDAQGRITAAANTTISGVTPGGAAGGDFTGTYPNPTINADAVTTAKILDGTIGTADLANGSVTAVKLSNTGVTLGTYGSATAVPQITVDAQGRLSAVTQLTITGVTPGGAAGGDLTGTYPNPTINADAVTSAKILDGTIGTADLANASVTAAKLANTGVTLGTYGSVTAVPQITVDAQGRLSAVTQLTIAGVAPGGAAGGDLTGTYPNPTLNADAVTTAKILDGTVSTADLANASVTAAKLANTGVTLGTYGSVTAVPQITVDAQGRLSAVTQLAISGVTPGGAAGGDLTGTYPNPTLNADAVTTAKILDGTIGTADFANASVTAAKLANTGVTLGTYGSVTAVPQITVDAQGRLSAVTQLTIAGVAPGGAAGGDLTGTYPNPTLNADAVTTAKILDGTVSTADLANASVTAAKLANTGVTLGTYGTAAAVPQITVDAQGRLSAVTQLAISGVTPGGAAGGDLTGTYPNPVINVDAVTTAKILDGTVGTTDLANASVTAAKLANTGVTSGTYGTAAAVPQITVDSQGRLSTVTQVAISGVTPGGAAGGDLTGTYPNPTIAGNAVGSAEITDGSIVNADISGTAALDVAKLTAGAAAGYVLTTSAGLIPQWAAPGGTALIQAPGTQNLFAGSPMGTITTGTANTFYGSFAGTANTTGSWNVFMGIQAGQNTTTGGLNTLIGWQAGMANATATFNGNTFVGAQAGSAATGGPNTFIGEKAGLNTTTGTECLLVGNRAGQANTTGGQHTILGYQADVATSGLQNATAIGYSTIVNASNKVRIGNGLVTVIEGQVAFTNASDMRLKKNIKDIDAGLDFVLKLRPVSYHMKNENDPKINWGFIAQDIEGLVGTDNAILTVGGDKDRTLGLRYTDFVAPLVKAVQEQEQKIENLQATLLDREKQIDRLETTLHNLEAKIIDVTSVQDELEKMKKTIEAMSRLK